MTFSNIALAKKLDTGMTVKRPSNLCFNESLSIDLDSYALADVECVGCRHFTAFERHVREADPCNAVVAAMNEGVYLDRATFVSGYRALPASHNCNSIGPHRWV